jgi:hypothetical protein
MGQHTPPKHELTFNRLYGVISQMIELFTTTAVTTSNPTWVRFATLLLATCYLPACWF